MRLVETEVAVIGAGTAGLAAFAAARAAGASAMLIEGGAHGTTCARVGCMPSKLLIAAAGAAHAVAAAPAFGVRIDGTVRVDGVAVMERVRRERDRFVGFVLRDVANIRAAERLRGHAVFVDDHTLDVGGHTRVVAKAVVIATGARASRDVGFDAIGDRLIVSDDVFDWRSLPKSVAVIGAGVLGIELGQALHRLGVRVAILGRGGGVGSIGDPQLLAAATAAFKREFTLEPDAAIADMRRAGDGVAIERAGPDDVLRVETFEWVLAATGRTPDIGCLGLDNTSVRRDAKGVPCHDPATAQTVSVDDARGKDSPIFIAGDAGNRIPLLHEAADEGTIAGKNAARFARGRRTEKGLRRARLAVVFTDPQIGVVGGGFRALEPGSFATGQVDFADQGRARVLLRNRGLLHVYADKATGRLLGAEMLAPGAEHLSHLLAWALQARMTITQMLAMPFYHPVLEEGLRTALQDVSARLAVAHQPA